MSYNDYEYDYDSEDIEDLFDDNDYDDYDTEVEYENYYHNITDELVDE